MKPFYQITLGILFTLISHSIMAQKPGSYTGLDLEKGENVTIANHSSLNPRNAMTIEAWIKVDQFGTNVYSNSIVDKHDWVSGNAGYILRCGASGVLSWNFASRSTGAWVETNSSAVMQTGVWYHVAGTFDGDTARVYINGVLQNTTINSTQINTSTSAIKIGAGTYATGRDFDGSIDEVRIWETALDEATLRKWMCRSLSTSHPKNSNLVAYYKFDEATGTKITDASSNSNDGKTSSNSLWVNSGAALGDTSVYTYSGAQLKYNSQFGDQIIVNNISGSPTSTHLYSIDKKTAQETKDKFYAVLDQNHYFGVFQTGGTSPTYDLEYSYKNNSSYNGTKDCGFDLLSKSTGNTGEWKSNNQAIIYANDSTFLSKQSSQEYINANYPQDSTLFVKSSNGKTWFCEGESIELIAAGNSSFTYKWYKNNKLLSNTNNWLKVDSSGTFTVEATRKGTSCKFKSEKIQITSKKKPSVSLSNLKVACEDLDSIVLKGGTPLGGKYLGANIKNDSVFAPSRVGPGKYQVIYTYTDPSTTCSASDTATQYVAELPKVYMVGSYSFCNNQDSIPLLQAYPKGGVYVGNGIENEMFFPKKVNQKAGFYPFTYTYTDTFQCSNTYVDSVELKAVSNVFLLPIPNSCENDVAFSLKGSPTGGSYSGLGMTGKNFDPKAASSGMHDIIYTYTNSDNCTASDTQTATVFANTKTSWSQNITACAVYSTILLKGGTPSGGTYSGPGVGGHIFRPRLAGSGKHTLNYTYIDSNQCKNISSIEATILDTTKLNIGPPPKLCPNIDSSKLDFITPKGGVYSGDFLSNNYFKNKSAGVGDHVITYTYTAANSCPSKYPMVIKVVKTDSVSINLPSSVCDGDNPIKINTYPSGGTLAGRGIIGDYFSPAFAGLGTHTLSYSITDSNQCDAKAIDSIVVSEIPKVSLEKFNSVCKNDEPFQLVGGSPADGKYYINELESTMFTPLHEDEGEYIVKYVFVNQHGCSDSAETSFMLNLNPTKPIITKKEGRLISSASKNNQWYNEQGIINGETNKDFEPKESGDYWVIVTNNSNCSSRSEDFYFEFVGITQNTIAKLILFPNPNNGIINLSRIINNAQYKVYSMDGSLLLSGELGRKIDLKNLASGMYIIEIKNSEGLHRQRVQKN